MISSITSSGTRGSAVPATSAFALRRPAIVSAALKRREVRAEEHLMRRAVFNGGHEGVIKLPGTGVKAADVGVDIGVLAHYRDRFPDPGVPHMRHDDLEIWEANCDLIHLPGLGKPERRFADEGRPLVPHDGDAKRVGFSEHGERPIGKRVVSLVDGADLEAAQPKLLDRML